MICTPTYDTCSFLAHPVSLRFVNFLVTDVYQRELITRTRSNYESLNRRRGQSLDGRDAFKQRRLIWRTLLKALRLRLKDARDGERVIHGVKWRHCNLWSYYDLYAVGQHRTRRTVWG